MLSRFGPLLGTRNPLQPGFFWAVKPKMMPCSLYLPPKGVRFLGFEGNIHRKDFKTSPTKRFIWPRLSHLWLDHGWLKDKATKSAQSWRSFLQHAIYIRMIFPKLRPWILRIEVFGMVPYYQPSRNMAWILWRTSVELWYMSFNLEDTLDIESFLFNGVMSTNLT